MHVDTFILTVYFCGQSKFYSSNITSLRLLSISLINETHLNLYFRISLSVYRIVLHVALCLFSSNKLCGLPSIILCNVYKQKTWCSCWHDLSSKSKLPTPISGIL